jgi:hypothetical protein
MGSGKVSKALSCDEKGLKSKRVLRPRITFFYRFDDFFITKKGSQAHQHGAAQKFH